MSFTKITTAGAGTMGSQVAWQMAFHGKHVTVYDAIPAGLQKGKALHREYAEHFIAQRGATPKQVDDTFARLTYTTDLAAAVRDADLISESVPESMSIKESFWREASKYAPAKTVFTTNTSTLPPSALVGFVDCPQKFLALHFAIGVWDANIGEVMGHSGTDTAVFESLLTFAEEIGLVPIPIRKEQSGYIINSLLVPWCTAALELLVRGVSDFQSIDRTWMITLQTGMGPLRDDRSHGPRSRVSRRKADRRNHPEHPGARVRSLPRRALHPEGPPRDRERPGLLPLPQSGLRATGIHLVESALEAPSGSARSSARTLATAKTTLTWSPCCRSPRRASPGPNRGGRRRCPPSVASRTPAPSGVIRWMAWGHNVLLTLAESASGATPASRPRRSRSGDV